MLSETFLEQNYGPKETWADYNINGYFITATYEASLGVINCQFRRGIGKSGSAIHIQFQAAGILEASVFEYNYGNKGAFNVNRGNYITLKSDQFSHNQGTIADAFMEETVFGGQVQNNRFQYSEGTSLFLGQGLYSVGSNTFSSISHLTHAVVKVERNNAVEFNNNTFQDSQVARVFHFSQNAYTSELPRTVYSNILTNITGTGNGIGILVQNSKNMIILDNELTDIKFASLSGTEEAAGIYIDESSMNTSIYQNSFTQCIASIGGALSFKNGFVTFSNNLYSQNQAHVYGPNVAAFPVSLERREYTALPQMYKDQFPRLLREREMLNFNEVRSGSSLDGFYVVLLDQYGDVVTSSSGNTVTMLIEQQEEAAYAPKAETLIQIRDTHGVYDLSTITFSGEPSKRVRLTLNSNAINPSLSAHPSSSLAIEMQFRSCLAGEEYTDDGRCIPCTSGFYSLQAPQSITSCEKCPNNAVCFGGSMIAPQPGYWRSSVSSLNFLNCYNEEACTGSSESDFDPMGKCYSGYKGILCAQCEPGYVRDAKFQCAECPEEWQNILILVVIVLVATAVLIVLIRATLQSMKNQNSLLSVYLKILANHLQLVLLTLSFELDWPDQVKIFFDITQPAVDVASRVISLDCFLDSTRQGMKNVYIYLLVYLLLPLMAVGFSLLFWFLYIRGNRRRALNRSITTVIILFFLLHPSLTKNVFNIFQCRDIDGTSRLIQDLDIECYTGEHLLWAVIGGGLGLLFWVIGIPWLAWTILRERKTHLQNDQQLERYGFLYKGYKMRTYYWESVVMFRKVAMIFIAVFLRSAGTRIQAFIVFILLLFFVIVTEEKKPYTTRKLNTLEVFSLVASCVTIYSGFFFLSATVPSSPFFDANKDFSLTSEWKWFFFLVILLSNLLFLLYWSFNLVGEVRGMCRTKYPRFYLCFCLCRRSDLLKEEKQYSKAFEANERLIELIDNNILIMKKARHLISERKMFVDWNKFTRFLQSQSTQLNKFNFDKPLKGEGNRKSRRGKGKHSRQNSELDYNSELDLDRTGQRSDYDMKFRQLDGLDSLNQSSLSSTVQLYNAHQEVHQRETSISNLANSPKLTYRCNGREDDEPKLTMTYQESSEEGSRSQSLEPKQINRSLFAPRVEQPSTLYQASYELEDQFQQNQSILQFFQLSEADNSAPVVFVEEQPRNKKKSPRKTKRSKSLFNELQRIHPSGEVLSERSTSSHFRRTVVDVSIMSHEPSNRDLKHTQANGEAAQQRKGPKPFLQEEDPVEQLPDPQECKGRRMISNSSFKKINSGEKEEQPTLFDSFMNNLDEQPV